MLVTFLAVSQRIIKTIPSYSLSIIILLWCFGIINGTAQGQFKCQIYKNVISASMSETKGHPSGGGENSQILSSYVLVPNIGHKPMTFKSKFARQGSISCSNKRYITSPNRQFICGNMKISVLDPINYIAMTNELIFSYNTRADQNVWFPVGYCFRWH